MRRILITGAAGRIGSEMTRLLPRENEIWRLTDIRPIEEDAGHEYIVGDLSDMDFALSVCEDVDAIIHLAGQPKERSWSELLAPNVVALVNIWEAARLKGVGRMIFGSSSHVTGMYPNTYMVTPNHLPRPDSRYGAAKMFGDALASLYADKFGVKGFSIRIGSCLPAPRVRRELATWISPKDLASLMRVGLDGDYHNEVVYGISGNTRAWHDNSRAYELGYKPEDNAEEYLADITILTEPHLVKPSDVLQGGGSCDMDFSGDLDFLLQMDKEG